VDKLKPFTKAKIKKRFSGEIKNRPRLSGFVFKIFQR